MTNSKTTLSNEEAIAQALDEHTALELIRNLGNIFVVALQDQTGKKPKSTSPLMNGLVAYEYLNLKGEREDLDEAVDIVVRIVYETVVEQIEADTIKIGR